MNSLLRKLYLGLLYWICPILLLSIGLMKTLQWLLYRFELERWIDRYHRVLDRIPEKWVHIAWLSVSALAIFVLCLETRRFFTRTVLSLKTDGGRPLKVRKTAVNRYVRSCLIGQPYVKDVRVQARSSGGALALKLRVWLAATDKIDNLQEDILKHVVEEIRKGFGISKVHDPEILIEAVKPDRSKTPQAPPAESYDTPAPSISYDIKEEKEEEEVVVEETTEEPSEDTARTSYTGFFDSESKDEDDSQKNSEPEDESHDFTKRQAE